MDYTEFLQKFYYFNIPKITLPTMTKIEPIVMYTI